MEKRRIAITEVGPLRIGHAQDTEALTGCTVLLPGRCAPAGVSVRGGGPASRETDLLKPTSMAPGIHGLVLSGGSAFGLASASGVMQYLEEQGIGFDVGVTKVPLVPASCLFDLAIGDARVRPDAAMGYAACLEATTQEVASGCVGAGTGCTVGTYYGVPRAMKSGIGSYAVACGSVRVGAIVAVNAMGDVRDLQGRPLAGLRSEDGTSRMSTVMAMESQVETPYGVFQQKHTTIGAIVTNAAFSKAELTKIADMAHDGLSHMISPVHTTVDGDTLYALSLDTVQADINGVGILAVYCVEMAIQDAIQQAVSLGGIPSASDW